MPRTSPHSGLKKRSGNHRGLKVSLLVLIVLLVLLALNAFALDNETRSAKLNVSGATLVSTTSGRLQVLDTGNPQQTGGPGATGSRFSLPILLIHGSGGAINWWENLIPLLSPTTRVVAVDMLGYGGSDKPGTGYSIENQAGLIAQVLNHEGIDQAMVVGHSLGAEVATSLAEQAPDLVAGATVIDDAPDQSYGGLSGTAKLARIPVIGQALWRISPDSTVKHSLSQAFAPGYEVSGQFVDDIREMTYTAYKQSYAEGDDYSDQKPLNQRLQATGKPLQVIFGAEDQIFPARESISAYAAIPGVTTTLIAGAGHSPQVEQPEKTAEAILNFLGRLNRALAPPPAPKPKPKKPKPKQGSKKNSKPTQKKPAGRKKSG